MSAFTGGAIMIGRLPLHIHQATHTWQTVHYFFLILVRAHEEAAIS